MRAVLVGTDAFVSAAPSRTVSTTVLTTFQFVSTARTATENDDPAVCGMGVPVLPVIVPAAAVSPGISSCSFAKAPGFTVVEVPVLAVIVPLVTSVAVIV